MSLLKEEGGCKVGWAWYDNEAEADARSKVESEARERKFAQGYDFGYQWPGSYQHFPNHPELGECWCVVTT